MTRAVTVEHAECSTGTCEHYQEMVRLRRNLHDGLGPGLAGIMMRADILGKLMTANRGAAEEVLRELRHEAAAFMTEFRRVLADQSPAELDGRRLEDALRTLAERMSPALSCDVRVDPAAAGADRAVQVAAFWIAKEALTNVVKHARARTCRIRVRVAGADLRLSIVDDGVGGAGLARRGVGLSSMRGRAAELGGRCEVTGNDPGTGVTVRAHFPLTATEVPQ